MLFAAVPKIIGFVVIVAIGWIIAALIARAIAAVLRVVHFNDLAQKSGFSDFVSSMGVRNDSAGFLAQLTKWFIRLVGKPLQNFAFTSFAEQTVSCTAAGPDGVIGTADDVLTCSAEWVLLASYNLASGGCVKQVKLSPGGVKAGGKTPFCDITDGFEVDVDQTGDGVPDLLDQFVFTTSCLDDPLTLDVNESQVCPLNSIIWDIDEESTTSKAIAQIFVAHTASADIKRGKIVQ